MYMRHIVAPWEWLANLQDRVSQGLFLNDACQKISFLNYLFCFSNNAFVIKKTIHKNYLLYNPIDSNVKV